MDYVDFFKGLSNFSCNKRPVRRVKTIVGTGFFGTARSKDGEAGRSLEGGISTGLGMMEHEVVVKAGQRL